MPSDDPPSLIDGPPDLDEFLTGLLNYLFGPSVWVNAVLIVFCTAFAIKQWIDLAGTARTYAKGALGGARDVMRGLGELRRRIAAMPAAQRFSGIALTVTLVAGQVVWLVTLYAVGWFYHVVNLDEAASPDGLELDNAYSSSYVAWGAAVLAIRFSIGIQGLRAGRLVVAGRVMGVLSFLPVAPLSLIFALNSLHNLGSLGSPYAGAGTERELYFSLALFGWTLLCYLSGGIALFTGHICHRRWFATAAYPHPHNQTW